MAFPYSGVLFLCRGNSVRSQMAEGLFRDLAPDDVKVWSAGLSPIGVDERSAAVMKEIGIDISGHSSKGVIDVPLEEVDLVITLCEFNGDPCPNVDADAARLSWPTADPFMATPMGGDGLDAFRAVRDELRGRILHLLNDTDRPS